MVGASCVCGRWALAAPCAVQVCSAVGGRWQPSNLDGGSCRAEVALAVGVMRVGSTGARGRTAYMHAPAARGSDAFIRPRSTQEEPNKVRSRKRPTVVNAHQADQIGGQMMAHDDYSTALCPRPLHFRKSPPPLTDTRGGGQGGGASHHPQCVVVGARGATTLRCGSAKLLPKLPPCT